MTITVFTDGACSGNPGPGGWGWAVKDGPFGSGCEKQTTNQRMEVMAVLDALQTFLSRDDTDDVEIVSDSTYVVNCFRDSWWRGWESRGWKNSQKQPVANQDLWKPLVALYKQNQSRVAFRWVKGHSGHPMNDLVDQLAVAAGKSQSPRRVVGLEPQLEPNLELEPKRELEPAEILKAGNLAEPGERVESRDRVESAALRLFE